MKTDDGTNDEVISHSKLRGAVRRGADQSFTDTLMTRWVVTLV